MEFASRPPFVGENDETEEDRLIYHRLWGAISVSGIKGRGPLLEPVLTDPKFFGIKNVVRQELMKIVLSSLEKADFIGKKEDFRIQSKLAKVLRMKAQLEDGGMF